MRKLLFICLCCLIPIWQYIYAESTESGYDDSEEVFEYVDLEQVPTGILADYGIHLVAPELYDGIVSETNCVTPFVWKSLYAGLQSSIVNSKCVMEESNDVFDFLSENNALGIMYYKYNTFAEDALKRGLVTFEDGKIRIVQGQPSPYVEKECFAVMPIEGSFPYVFDKNNFFTNTGLDVTKIEYKIGNGNYGVIPISSGMSHRVPVNTPGEYDITFRVTFSNGKTMESHSIITVPQEKADPEKAKDNYGIATLGTINADYSQYGGAIQVKYMKNSPAKGKLVRPLIIVEDMDLSILSSKFKMNLDSLMSQGGGIGDAIDQLSQLYDIIYVDFNDGLDDLLRNAEMLHKALVMVNQNRYDKFSDESYIVGLGTGGVIARMAVNMMENANEDHKVQKIVSVNSPLKGINIPVCMQAMIRHAYEFGIQVEEKDASLKNTFEPYAKFLDKTALQQLSMHYVKNFTLDNSVYNSFINNKLVRTNPKNCETINISNGDYCEHTIYRPYTKMIDINTTIISQGGNAGGGGADIGINGYMIPNRDAKNVYLGTLRMIIKVLGMEFHKIHNYKSIDSTNNMYPIDGESGTYLETRFINSLANSIDSKLNGIIKTDKFCFVPTFSALDLDAEKYFVADDLEDLRGEGLCVGDGDSHGRHPGTVGL